jgi:site-specific DNA recombinase
MKLLGYVRVSRVMGREGDSFISPAVQRERIEAWCTMHGHELLAVHTDLDESGGKTDRPEFQAAIASIERGEAAGLVVAKLDRFARSIAGAAETIRRLDAAGATLVSVAENIDSASSGGRLMRTILFAFAEFERERHIEGWNATRAHVVERGKHSGAVVPRGYVKGDDGRLTVDPVTAPSVVAAFEAVAAGEPRSRVARRIGTSAGTLHYMLNNRAYLGELRDGPYVNAKAHPPLVSRALFEAAGAARGNSTPRSGEGHLLAGLIRCAGCRHSMGGGYTRHGRDKRVGRYACNRYHSSGHCPSGASATGPLVEQLVVDAFLARHTELRAVPLAADLSDLEAAVNGAEAELSAYVSVMRATDPGYRDGYDARVAEMDTARRALADAASTGALSLPPVALLDHWRGATITERRELLAADITAVFVKAGRAPIDERVRIVWRGEQVELPKRGRHTATMLPPYEWGAADAGMVAA